MSHSDFQLPGLSQHPDPKKGIASLISTLAFLYSRRWNRRRLEHHTYGFWTKVFSYLIFDLEPYVFHIPQLAIHPPPLQYPDSSFRTDAGSNGDETLPDFTVMGVSAMNRFSSSSDADPRFPDLEKWEELVIKWAKPFIVAEMKRAPPRSTKDKTTFCMQLEALMRTAMDDAESQALIAFNVTTYKDLKELILLVACGEWWRFGVFTKALVVGAQIILPPERDSDDEADKVSYQRAARGKTKKASGPRISPLIRHSDLGDLEEKLFEEVEDAMPPIGKWSLNIQFGTEASNQRLYLIHCWLKEQRGVVGAAPYRDGDESPVRLTLKLESSS